MNNMKKRFYFMLSLIVVLFFAVTCAIVPASAKAEDAVKDYDTSVNISDGQFNVSGSAIVGVSANWVGAPVGDFKEQPIAGIVNLGSSSVSKEEFLTTTGLDLYSEYANTKPVTPFGKNEQLYPGTNTCVLMINTNNRTHTPRGTAYGFTSDSVTLAANSFYKLTAWVKTGSFAQDTGAVVKLSGFEHDIGFWNIDTSDVDAVTDETNGFRLYTIFVATAQNTVTASVKLQVGDSYTFGEPGESDYMERITPSEGYAFFDNVVLTRLSANAFNNETSVLGDRICVYDAEKEAVGIIDADVDHEYFDNGLKDLTVGFKDDTDYSGTPKFVDTFTIGEDFNGDNLIELSENPYTYKGTNAFVDDRDILILKADESPSSVYVQTKQFTIEPNKFYRLSTWAKTMDFSSGNAALVVVGENNIPFNDFELPPVSIGDISSGDDMMARYGWQKYSFFLKGSYSKECKVSLQCWLGYSSNCKGTVMFDDVTLEEVTYDFYTNNVSGGTEVTFDAEPSTTISNGRFFNAESYKGPTLWKPVEWSAIGNADDGASGIILTGEDHYNKNIASYYDVPNPVSQAADVDINSVTHPSMLMLATRNSGYFGYTSPTVSITNSHEFKVSVTLYATEMTGSGANLWLTTEGKVISSIKNIMTTHNNFETFEFYIEGDEPFSTGTGTDYNVQLNIALGREDAAASGNIYVAEAAFTTLGDGEYDAKLEQFKSERRFNPTYDMYSFRSLEFYGYDNSDKNAIKESTNWAITTGTVGENGNYNYRHGVFDPHNKDDNYDGGNIPTYVTKAYDNLESDTKFGMVYMLQSFNSAVTSQFINPIKLEADAYYMVTLQLAVKLEDNDASYGASIQFVGDGKYDAANFTDIKSTLDYKGELEFRPYQFYFQTSDETTTLYLRVSLGDTAYSNRRVSGSIYIAEFAVENLGGSMDELEETDLLKIVDNHVTADEENSDDNNDDDSDTGDEETTTPVGNDTERWWLIPSILFGVAIVLAVVGTAIRSIVEKASRKQKRHQLNSYDRRYGTAGDEKDETTAFDDTVDNKDENAPVIEQDVEAFNDDEPAETPAPADSDEQKPEAPAAAAPTPKSKKERRDDINDFDE